MKAKINETHSRLCINGAKFKYTFNRITSERAEVEERRNIRQTPLTGCHVYKRSVDHGFESKRRQIFHSSALIQPP